MFSLCFGLRNTIESYFHYIFFTKQKSTQQKYNFIMVLNTMETYFNCVYFWDEKSCAIKL